MFNLRKQSQVQEKALRDQNEEFGLSTDGLKSLDKLLDDNKKDADNVVGTTEVQMEKARSGVPDQLTEAQLSGSKSKFYNHRSEKAGAQPVKPLDLLNEAQYQDRLKAYKKAQDGDDSTALWDKYVGSDLQGPATKMVDRMGPSQLQNDPDRFKSLKSQMTDGDVNKNLKGYEKSDDVKKMVMASLFDADAMLFSIYHDAAVDGRSLTGDEQSVVQGIAKDKAKLLAQLGDDKYVTDVRLELTTAGINPKALLDQINYIEAQMSQAVKIGDHGLLEQLHEKHQDLIAKADTLVGR